MTRATRLFPLALPLAALAVALTAAPAARAAHDGVVPAHERANIARSSARIDENINETVPLDLTFRDEADRPITLGEAMGGRPTILVPVYYRCPMLCTKVLTGLLEACRDMPQNYSAGSEFTVVAVSMDPKEHGDLARAKKKAYLDGDPGAGLPGYGRVNGEAGWRFLTGTKESVGALLNAVGFRFEFDKMVKEYDHPTGVVILSPQGKITRYFYGIGFDGEFELGQESAAWAARGKPPLTEAELRDRASGARKFTRPTTTLRLSLIEAADGKGGSLMDKVMMSCYRYNSLNQGYALSVLTVVRYAGAVTLAAIVAGVAWGLRRERRKARAAAQAATVPAVPAGALSTGMPSGGTA